MGMRRYFRRHWKRVAFIAVVAMLLTGWLTAAVRGNLVAHFDVARGHYEMQEYGLPSGITRDCWKLLQDRYGIRHRTVAGCRVMPWVVWYSDAYNEVVMADARRKYGRDVFGECRDEVMKAYEEQRNAQGR